MEELLELLERVRPGVDFENEKYLVDGEGDVQANLAALPQELHKAPIDVGITISTFPPTTFCRKTSIPPKRSLRWWGICRTASE